MTSLPKELRTDILYEHAETAQNELDELLREYPAARTAVSQLTRILLGSDRRVVLYLGAGCSRQVNVQVPRAYPEFRGRGWVELLDELIRRMDKADRKEFLSELGIRSGQSRPPRRVGRLLEEGFDKQQIAWFISCRLGVERDALIDQIVEPPVGSTRESPLHEQLLDLAFSDIVTTNYDTNIEYFNGNRERQLPLQKIVDAADIARRPDHASERRVFYLHGRVGETRRRLVFDRFDYAELLAQHDGLLAYVTHLLRDSHVIYVGFGLDDSSFNLMETRLYSMHGTDRPESFAFMSKVTEAERRAWRSRNLHIVDYLDDKQLPGILSCINTICAFVRWAEPTRPKGVSPADDRTRQYFKDALDAYVRGDFETSLVEARAALASTLFWERNEISGDRPTLPFRESVRVCEIRIRMALNHYKLKSVAWSGNPVMATPTMTHPQRMITNMKAAERRIEDERKKQEARSGLSWSKEAILALENSLSILKARIKYHQPGFDEARLRYEKVTNEETAKLMKPTRGRFVPQTEIWRLKLAEGFFYARCQLSRIRYQFLDGGGDQRHDAALRSRRREVEELTNIFTSAETTLDYINEHNFGAEYAHDRRYYEQSLRTICSIARWTAGRHAIGIFRDVLPTIDERTDKADVALTKGIKLLKYDYGAFSEGVRLLQKVVRRRNLPSSLIVADICDVIDSLQSTANQEDAQLARRVANDGIERLRQIVSEAGLTVEETPSPLHRGIDLLQEAVDRGARIWKPSPRWQALRFRYLSRGYALRWLLRQCTNPADQCPDGDLVEAYTAIQTAIACAAGPGLERQQIVNSLEAARLNLFAISGDALRNQTLPRWHDLSPLSAAAGIFYLDQAFAGIERFEDRWLCIIGKRVASYFGLLSRGLSGLSGLRSKKLKAFFQLSIEEMQLDVEREHREFASAINKPHAFDSRIKFYHDTFSAIRDELGRKRQVGLIEVDRDVNEKMELGARRGQN